MAAGRRSREPEIVILAGGVGARFQSGPEWTDKLLVPVQGYSSLERVVSAARSTGCPVAVVTRRDRVSAYRRLLPDDLPVWSDAVAREPHLLEGLRTARRRATSRWVFALAADHPYLTPRVLRRLIALPRTNVDAVVPIWPDGTMEPLTALYRRALLPTGPHRPGGRASDVVRSAQRVLLVPVHRLAPDRDALRGLRSLNRPGGPGPLRTAGAPRRPPPLRTVRFPERAFRRGVAAGSAGDLPAVRRWFGEEADAFDRLGLTFLARQARRDSFGRRLARARPR